jgi:hypothetical protein
MNKPKIYFIVTTCLLQQNFEIRKKEYTDSINTLIQEVSKYNHLETFIYIVENNGARHTFLNDFVSNHNHVKLKVIYTNHNQIPTPNKGLKELLDYFFILQECKEIRDQDIVVKLTGRYRFGEDSTFLNILYNHYNDYDAFIRTGAFMYPSQRKNERDQYDCLTGLFGIRAYIMRNHLEKYIQNLRDYEWVEWVIIMIIQNALLNERIKFFDYLGIWIKTAYMNEYQLF